MVAAILALFLGGIGIHKFYLGETFWGIIYLLFCWTFIPMVVGWVEAVAYLFTSKERFTAKFG